MIYVGIDVSKDKHDCFITNSEGEVLFSSFTIPNNRQRFETLFENVLSASNDTTKIKVGLEATGHYNYNLLGFLIDKGLATFVINPLHTNLYRKSMSLRKTKTDKIDARTIASVHLTRLSHLITEASKGLYSKEDTIKIREAARNSIGSHMPAKSLELKHTIKLVREIDSEITEIESEIKTIMDKINSPILTVPGISYRMGVMIIAEIGDFNRFDSADKILAYAGMSPST